MDTSDIQFFLLESVYSLSLYKNIVITGASSGVGKALALFYSRPGVNLCLIARGVSGSFSDLIIDCKAKGATIYPFYVDVCIGSSMDEVANSFINEVGSIDLVIANAGIREVEDEGNQDASIPHLVMGVNFFGVLNTVRPFLPLFKKQNSGHIAVISSIAAYRGMPNSGIYSASKAALNVWFESLRLRTAKNKLKITVISLSFVNTPMTSKLPFWMPGLMEPEEAASKIGRAIAHNCRTIIIPWQSKIIWGLLILMPNILFDKFIIFAKRFGPKRK